jgi:glycosyltransferase involved in cell wall biosynthesis
VLRGARAVLFTSEEERRQARESFWLYRCNEQVVNYGTAGPAGDRESQRRLFQEKFPHLQGKRCLLFLGRVHVKKGPDLLFRALAQAREQLPKALTRDVHLVMAGPKDHAYGREMEDLACALGLSQMVTWTGMVTGDLKWGAFHSAEAFILPSHQENFGVAVAESLACGTPVLISKRVNIWREVADDGAGLAEANDLAGTTKLIREWLAEPRQRWAERRAAARACFERRFTIARSAESLVRVIGDNIKGRSA